MISVYIAASIDGYIAGKNDELDFLNLAHNDDGEDYGFYAFHKSVDTLILGRSTYDITLTAPKWPHEGKRTIVLSRTLTSVVPEAELYSGDLETLVSSLDAKRVWVDGGTTISQFLEKDLIDEIIVSVVPIILGEGKPLFHPIARQIPCKLLACNSYPTGLIQYHYQLEKSSKARYSGGSIEAAEV